MFYPEDVEQQAFSFLKDDRYMLILRELSQLHELRITALIEGIYICCYYIVGYIHINTICFRLPLSHVLHWSWNR